AYYGQGNFEKALDANSKYILTAPNEPNPYDSRGSLFARNGMLDSSIVAYQKALEIKPDFYTSLEELGVMYVLKGKYEKAAECYHKMASAESKSMRSQGRYYLSLIPLYQGKMREALQVLDDCMAADRLEGADSEQGYKHVIKAVVYEGINIPDSAFYEIVKSFDYPGRNYMLYYSMMAQNGEIQKARLELE
ncbi:MAG: tetratricopeptide repeat protein, partial [bacterium]|nr:tetratricopeptide repeat protein [bacterium]